MFNTKRGFTLIELLVVIAIIGMLSSIVLASLNSARFKANDAKIRTDMHNLQLALQLYYDKNGSMPANPIPGSGVNITSALQGLVTQGFISSLPTSPYASTGYVYQYYDYGPGTIGALLVASLGGTPGSTGYPGTCRPFTGGTNWCDSGRSDTYYCMCNPY